MASQPLQSLNQFTQGQVIGMQALSSTVALQTIQCVVSATGSASLYAGQAVQFDNAITSQPSALPQIISASGTQYADGYILYDVKGNAPFVNPVVVSVVLGGILWMLCESTVEVGQVVQDGTDVGGVAAFATSNYYPRGVSLDYGTVGQLIRVNLQPAVAKAVQAAAHA